MATYYSTPQGAFRGLPLKANSSGIEGNPFYPPSFVTTRSETMTDAGSSVDRTAIRAVDHVKIVPSRITPTGYFDTSIAGGITVYPTLADSNALTRGQLCCLTHYVTSIKGVASGVANADSSARMSLWRPSDSGVRSLSGAAPTDKLAQVPARLVRAIEEWHASTALIESRDLPELFTMWKRREPLRNGLASAIEYLRGRHTITGVKTLGKLCEAYRSGSLGYMFGIMPTVQDIRTLHKCVTQGVKPKRERIRVTLRGQSVGQYKSKSPANSQRWEQTEDATDSRVDGAYAYIRKNSLVSEGFTNAVNRLVGVNGAALIWEVLPMTWCIDMICSIDDMLDVVWANSQTKYDIVYWSTTKTEYRRTVNTWSLAEVSERADLYDLNANEPFNVVYSHYKRVKRDPPSPIDAFRFRMSATGLWLSLMVGIGLIPDKYRGLAR